MSDTSLEAQLRTAQQLAHASDANAAEAAAQLHDLQAALERANARTARAHAEAVNAQAAVAEVRRLCELTIDASVRVQAVDQARDTLAAIARCMDGTAVPADGAWGEVWLHGNWRYLTSKMSTAEREHAADAVARWSDALAAYDDMGPVELEGLRWWRSAD
ncbi:hypothetical protein ACFXHD_09780 [Streptomyces hydrogenans]|uniref:hypothetical protein n=1 Tax=Streptomyces hydrogenans TaxID=1873719 RepID=UPI003688ACEC